MPDRPLGFVNLCRHDVNLVCPFSGRALTITPSGVVARVRESRCLDARLDGWPLFVAEAAEVECLPDPAPGVVYVASARVARLALLELGRDDVVSPDTDRGRRKWPGGRVLSVQGFFRPGAFARPDREGGDGVLTPVLIAQVGRCNGRPLLLRRLPPPAPRLYRRGAAPQ